MCINLNTEAVLLETKVVFTYLCTLQNSATILSMVALPAKRTLGHYKYSFLKEFMMDFFFLMKTWHIKVHRSQQWGESTGHQEAASEHTSAASFTPSGFSVYFSDRTLSISIFHYIYW